MPSSVTQPLVLRGLWMIAMGKAFMRFRNPRRRAAGRNQDAFHEKLWRDVAREIGAEFRRLSDDVAEIGIDGVWTRVMGNVSAIDDPATLALLHDKPATHQILSQQGLPVPRHATTSVWAAISNRVSGS